MLREHGTRLPQTALAGRWYCFIARPYSRRWFVLSELKQGPNCISHILVTSGPHTNTNHRVVVKACVLACLRYILLNSSCKFDSPDTCMLTCALLSDQITVCCRLCMQQSPASASAHLVQQQNPNLHASIYNCAGLIRKACSSNYYRC